MIRLTRSLLSGANLVYNVARAHNERQDKRAARKQSKRLERKILAKHTSGVHDSKLMSDTPLLQAKGYLNGQGGVVCFDKSGNFVTDPHDGHSITFGEPGAGKTTQLGLGPAIHTIAHSSMIIVDVDHEYSRSLQPFMKQLGIKCVHLNPSRAYNMPDTGYNPLKNIQEDLNNGKVQRAIRKAQKLSKILVPVTATDDSNVGWIKKGERKWLWISIIAECDRAANPCFSHIYENLSKGAFEAIVWINACTGISQVITIADRFHNELISKADKQAFWQVDGAANALETFSPGTDIAESTARHSVNFGDLKNEPTCVFVSIESDLIKTDGAWLSSVMACALDEIAEATGKRRVVCLLDEFSNTPAIPDFVSSMLAYRKRLIQLNLFCHSPQALERRYGKGEAAEIQAACSQVRYMSVPDPNTAKMLSEWSGTKTIYSRSINTSQRLDASGSIGESEQSKPQLSVADVISMESDEILVRLRGMPLFKGKRKPWWEVSPWNDGRIVDIRFLPDNRQMIAPLIPMENEP